MDVVPDAFEVSVDQDRLLCCYHENVSDPEPLDFPLQQITRFAGGVPAG
jgi:hypothetical protein